MTIASYTDLQSAMSSWTDWTSFSANLPDFITLFEATANRRLRVRQMLTTATLSPDSTTGLAPLPSDYLEWKRLAWRGSPRQELEYVEPVWLSQTYSADQTSTPTHFTIEGANVKIRPLDGTNLELAYYQKIPNLSLSNATNWLLTAHPDLYLAGSLAELLAFAESPDLLTLWLQRRDLAFDEINKLDQVSRGQFAMQVWGQTP